MTALGHPVPASFQTSMCRKQPLEILGAPAEVQHSQVSGGEKEYLAVALSPTLTPFACLQRMLKLDEQPAKFKIWNSRCGLSDRSGEQLSVLGMQRGGWENAPTPTPL